MKVTKRESAKFICPKCGFSNAFGTRTCYRCKAALIPEKISCPKCATKNEYGTAKCTNCGFDFTKKRRSLKSHLLINLGFSLLLMIVLFICIKIGEDELVDNFGFAFRIVSVVIIAIVLITTITASSNKELSYDAETEMAKKNPRLVKMKKIATIASVIAVVIVAIIAIIYF